MSEWKEVRLGDVIKHSCSGGTPKSNFSEYYDGDIPWLNTKEIDFNRIYHTERNITQLGLDNSSAKWIEEKCVIVAMYGATAGKISINMVPLTTNQACCNLKINESAADYRYIYYYLKKDFKILASLANGGAQQNLNSQIIKDYVIKLPSLRLQKEISDLLWSIDSKIETNNKLNEKLEEMAQAIFKSWFVDFEPFKDQPFHETELGSIPDGWEVTTIGEILKTALGGTPSRNRDDYWNGEIAWINSGEINKFRIIQASEYITENGLKSSATKLLPAKTTVLAITGATLGQVSLLEIDTCANQSVIGVMESDAIKHQFIYPLIKSKIKYLILHQTGGAQQHINKQNVDSIQFVLPPKDILDEYQIITKRIFDQISTLCFENQRLASLRDTLLPRLMSGEIKI